MKLSLGTGQHIRVCLCEDGKSIGAVAFEVQTFMETAGPMFASLFQLENCNLP